MKKIFFVILVLTLVGCNEEKTGIEIIPNYDLEFNTVSQVEVAATIEDAEKFKDEVANEIITMLNKNIIPKINLKYELFLDEKGKVIKLKRITNKDVELQKSIKLTNQLNELDLTLSKILSNKTFTSAKQGDQSVKFRGGLEMNFDQVNEKLINTRFVLFDGGFDKTEFFVAVEQMPEVIGGIMAIQKKIRYPEIAKRAGIQGRVYIKAFVDENGDVFKTELIKGIGGGCDEAAKNAVMSSKFKPGMQKGKAVKVQVSIPILFRLQ